MSSNCCVGYTTTRTSTYYFNAHVQPYNTMNVMQLARFFFISHKYQVHSVHRPVYEALLAVFPTEWDKMGEDLSISLSTRLYLIVMAYEANAQILLPVLYVGLGSYSASKIVAAAGDLPSGTLAQYLSGRESIALQLIRLLGDIMAMQLLCKSPTCMAAWRAIGNSRLIIFGFNLVDGPICPVATLSAIKDSCLVSEACGSCQRHSRVAIHAKARSIWISLPELFGWVSWQHLRRLAGTDQAALWYLQDVD
ncbi:hypothetical protein JB92DRAFT_2824787 [Gautieria morchelliformis]|nr:hypothetical protein JB92DRAFT_2824787 [Gautieria morchelliformis]